MMYKQPHIILPDYGRKLHILEIYLFMVYYQIYLSIHIEIHVDFLQVPILLIIDLVR